MTTAVDAGAIDTRAAAVRVATQTSAAFFTGALLTFPVRVMVAGILGPSGVGLVRLAELIQRYGAHLDGGLRYALARELPIVGARRQPDESRRLTAAALAWTWLFACAAMVVLAACYIAGFTFDGLLTPVNLVCLMIILAGERTATFLQSCVRGFGVFDALGAHAAITQILTPLIVLPLVLWLGVTGSLLAQIVVLLLIVAISLRYLRGRDDLALVPVWDRDYVVRLLRLGVVLYATVMSEGLVEVVGVVLLAAYGGAAEIGQFAFAGTMVVFTTGVTAGPNAVVARRMLEERGRQGDRIDQAPFRRFMGEGLAAYLLATTLLLAGAFFGYVAVVRALLPAFAPAVPIAQWLLAGQVMCAATYFFRMYFNATDQMVSTLRVVWSGLPLAVAVTLVALAAGLGAWGAAVANALTYFVYAWLLMTACTVAYEGGSLGAAWLMMRIQIVTAALVLFLIWLTGWQSASLSDVSAGVAVLVEVAKAAARLALFSAAALAAYAIVFRRFRPDREVLHAIGPMLAPLTKFAIAARAGGTRHV